MRLVFIETKAKISISSPHGEVIDLPQIRRTMTKPAAQENILEANCRKLSEAFRQN